MINVVIPMAGKGSRFSQAGYEKPKPFIDVGGIPMIELVLRNLYHQDAKYTLIGQAEHAEANRSIVNRLKREYNANYVTIAGITEGTACTLLHARSYFNDENPLVVANSDQFIEFNFQQFVDASLQSHSEGTILVFKDNSRNPKWSFVEANSEGDVIRVKEKEPISDLATVGIYLFRRGKDFIESAIDMILAKDKVNNEYYTCPVYNYLIQKKQKINVARIQETQMNGLGTPEDLQLYLKKIDQGQLTRKKTGN